jgi:hypothetical protein
MDGFAAGEAVATIRCNQRPRGRPPRYECELRVLFKQALLENRFREGRDNNGSRGWPDDAEYLRCKELLFVFPEALQTLVPDSIVWVSHCASITASP